jgi:hypothetical protein
LDASSLNFACVTPFRVEPTAISILQIFAQISRYFPEARQGTGRGWWSVFSYEDYGKECRGWEVWVEFYSTRHILPILLFTEFQSIRFFEISGTLEEIARDVEGKRN